MLSRITPIFCPLDGTSDKRPEVMLSRSTPIFCPLDGTSDKRLKLRCPAVHAMNCERLKLYCSAMLVILRPRINASELPSLTAPRLEYGLSPIEQKKKQESETANVSEVIPGPRLRS